MLCNAGTRNKASTWHVVALLCGAAKKTPRLLHGSQLAAEHVLDKIRGQV